MATHIIKIENGKLKGKTGKDYNKNKFYSFQGIPYAKPPIGELRFKAPVPAESWIGILDATVEGPESLSKHMAFKDVLGSEDCLHLSVYTPQLPKGGPLKPVMVWIHGGCFSTGSNKSEVYSPEFLITEDIVLVVINYRLGVLGFLSLEDTSLGVPGNAGLKDALLAFKWVKDNIKYFNGDPNNVTAFGQSAGAAICHYLMLSPLAKGLFHRAILQSGGCLNTWSRGIRNAITVAKIIGRNVDNEKEALKVLRSVPAIALLKAQDSIPQGETASVICSFAPVIEKPNPGAIITEHPVDIMRSGKYNKMPIIMGYNSREGIMLELSITSMGKRFTSYRNIDFQKTIPCYLNIETDSDMAKSVVKQVEDFYYGPDLNPAEEQDIYYTLETDANFVHGVHLALRAFMKTLDRPIYFYRLCYETSLNMFKKITDSKASGVCHGDDIGYLFKTKLGGNLKPGSVEEIAMRRVVKLWTNFAKTGNPNPKEEDPLLSIEWPQATLDQFCCLDIDRQLSIAFNPECKRMEFWDSIAKQNGIHEYEI